MELMLFNTMDRRLETFTPLTPGDVSMYTWGTTAFNFAHIGNFRAYMFEDLLHRVLAYFGYRVIQVMNLTDVDDKTIRDSRAQHLALKEFTAKYIDAFFADLKTLNITPAAVYPAATDHIGEMIRLIQTLIDKGYAYQAEDRCIYFSIDKFPSYGRLARIDRENQRSGVRIKNDEYAKDAVADFALWKAWDDNDGEVAWDSPWGKGRPGWHIECSAMAMKYLGPTFDIHSGRIDNMFPHHEDEIAQSECANGCQYVNYWLHCAHLMVNGEMMSKSAGIFFTLRDLLAKGYSGREVRYVLLGAHYRKKLNFTFEALDQARETLKKFDALFVRLKAVTRPGDGKECGELLADADAAFRTALADDLNIAEATAAVFLLQRGANSQLDSGNLSQAGAQKLRAQFRNFDEVLGFFRVDEAVEAAIPPAIAALAEQRLAAKKARNFAEADALREQLKAAGWLVEDIPGGFRLKMLD